MCMYRVRKSVSKYHFSFFLPLVKSFKNSRASSMLGFWLCYCMYPNNRVKIFEGFNWILKFIYWELLLSTITYSNKETRKLIWYNYENCWVYFWWNTCQVDEWNTLLNGEDCATHVVEFRLAPFSISLFFDTHLVFLLFIF
jgi:hypothetical protein